jgi:hypothetical protein
MSTLTVTNVKATNIQDSAGANGSTPAQISQGIAKAWVNFDGTGTPAINDSFNVTSITDNGTGDYTIVIETDMGNGNYTIAGTASDEDSTTGYINAPFMSAPVAGSFRISTDGHAGSVQDVTHVSCVIFGD